MKHVVMMLALCLALASCAKRPSETTTPLPATKERQESPLEMAMKKEWELPEDTLEQRKIVRQVVLDYFKSVHPDWQVHGISLNSYEGDTSYFTASDVIADGRSRVVQVRVWFIVKDDGQTYWKPTE